MVRVRSATVADIPAITAVAKHSATAAQWPPEEYQTLLSASVPRRVALVIEEESSVHGFLIARVLDKEWEIENIAVSGPARRRGLGKRLLGEFLDGACEEGAEAVFLEVRESNRAARSLYEKWAFVESGRRVRYYLEPAEDAIQYRLCFP